VGSPSAPEVRGAEGDADGREYAKPGGLVGLFQKRGVPRVLPLAEGRAEKRVLAEL
jgi:hypothetical protein